MSKKLWHRFVLERIRVYAERIRANGAWPDDTKSERAMIQALLKLFEEAEMTKEAQEEVEEGLLGLQVEYSKIFTYDHLGHLARQAVRYMKRD